jgi:hypothetical protein
VNRAFVGAIALMLLARTAAAAEPDTKGWADLFERHLSVMQINHRPAVTAFDYTGLARRDDKSGALSAIRSQLLAVPPSKMNADERTAWAINLYNFLVIERLMGLVGSGTPLPRDVRTQDFFSGPAVEVEGRSYSLIAFERHFLFNDRDPDGAGIAPAGLDPRIHFAIVNGSRGAPPLAPRPFVAATLDSVLDQVTRDALLSPAHLHPDTKTLRWTISSIFEWYEADFGGRAAVLTFLERYAPENAARQISENGEKALEGYIPWSWRPNQVSEEFRGAK